MKQKAQRGILMLISLMTIFASKAAVRVTVDGMEYLLSGAYASVYGVADNNTESTITIPSKIKYDNLTYTVNSLSDACFCNYYESYSGKRYTIVDGVAYEGASYCKYTRGELSDAGRRAKNCSYLKKIVLPETITTIGEYSCSNTQLKDIKLNEGIKTIGLMAFMSAQISSIIFPSTLQSISNDGGLLGCSLLRSITYTSSTPPSNWVAVSFTYVPSKMAYGTPKSVPYDNNYSIIELITFSQSAFEYTGKSPNTTWTNNMDGYSVKFEMATLNSEVGSYEAVNPATFTKGEESFTANIPYNYSIKRANLKAIANNTSKTYGEPNPDLTISYSGFVNGEDENVLITKPSLATTADKNSAVGTYPITISGGKAKNYTLEYEEGVLTVNKASLGIQVMDAIKVYGDENPTFTLSYSGLKNDETAPEWITAPQFTTDARKSSDAGQYPITITCEPKNYTILTNNSGTLTIERAPLTIKANNVSMDYCGTLPTYTYSYSGFVNGDDEKVLTSNPTMETDITQTSNVGTYVITPCGATAKNYVMTYIAGELTVKPITLIVKANNASRLYGDDNPDFELTYTGFVNNETKDVLNTEPTASTTATVKSYAGTYDISVSGGKALNYTFSYKSGQLTITSRNLNAYVGDYERAYGEDNPKFVITYEGFVNNDTEKSLNTKPSAKTNATKTSNVGTYDITLSGGYSPNYIFTYGQGKLTIVKAEQTFVWDQDLSYIEVGSQIELLAKASSGLPITYTMDSDEYAEIYKAGSKTYMECKKAGTFSIKAVQDGNDNYYSTQRINKKVTIVDEGGSAINTIQNSKVKVLSISDGISVIGVNSDDIIRIYTIDGALKKIVHAKGSQVEIPLHKDNMYVVKVGAKTVKLRL